MPTYEYKCRKCGKEFEAFQKITSKPGAKCPKCGAKATRQMSAGAGLVFKGSGFYLTDYGRSGQKTRAESESSSASSEKSSSSEKTEKTDKAESKPAAKPAEAKPKKKKAD